MGFTLRPGISFAIVGGRNMFLDAPRDRYFCLGRDAEAAFTALTKCDDISGAGKVALDRLVGDGLLLPTAADTVPIACAPPLSPRDSLLDAKLPHAPPLQTLAAIGSLASTSLTLKLQGFERLLRHMERRIAGSDIRGVVPLDRLSIITASFRRAATFRSSLDACLPRSFAAASRMLSLGIAPTLIIGVRLGPFVAHCWVQCGSRLVLDRLDEVRQFTPIRVLG